MNLFFLLAVCGTKGLACYNGGSCDQTTATCQCLVGFGGADCRAGKCAMSQRFQSPSIVVVKCPGYDHLYCYNGGCPTASGDPDAHCHCVDPYTGPDCSQMMCSHSAVTCYNGGECVDGQLCKCPPGYGGIDCRGRTSERSSCAQLFHLFIRLVPCGSGFCYHGGECVIDHRTGEAKCHCPGNYTLPDCSGGSFSSELVTAHHRTSSDRKMFGKWTNLFQ